MATSALTALVVVVSVIAHELAHGYVALLVGDPTAQRAGRLTWNPIKHVDPLLTLVVPAITLLATHGALVLGGAKPVPINPFRYRERERGDVLVSLAGVAANALILLAVVALLPLLYGLGVAGAQFARNVIGANAALIVFNLLPIPPLDGWRVARCIVRARRRRQYAAALRFADLESTS